MDGIPAISAERRADGVSAMSPEQLAERRDWTLSGAAMWHGSRCGSSTLISRKSVEEPGERNKQFQGFLHLHISFNNYFKIRIGGA